MSYSSVFFLKASPNELKQITEIKRISPGKIRYHGANCKFFLASLIMEPSSGIGAAAPNPKKDSVDIFKIMVPISWTLVTIMGDIMLGKIYLTTIWWVFAPCRRATWR